MRKIKKLSRSKFSKNSKCAVSCNFWHYRVYGITKCFLDCLCPNKHLFLNFQLNLIERSWGIFIANNRRTDRPTSNVKIVRLMLITFFSLLNVSRETLMYETTLMSNYLFSRFSFVWFLWKTYETTSPDDTSHNERSYYVISIATHIRT